METNSIYKEVELRDSQTYDFRGCNLKKREVDFAMMWLVLTYRVKSTYNLIEG